MREEIERLGVIGIRYSAKVGGDRVQNRGDVGFGEALEVR